MPLEQMLAGAGLLILFSIMASKVSDRAGMPALILFLLIGMLAGSEGIGGVEFDDPLLAQSLGIVALAYILFSGGLDTDWRSVRPVLGPGVVLSTIAVVLTAVIMGVAATLFLGLPWLHGLLLGAIVSSTDAAAVFSAMRSRGIGLKRRLRRILELESGSNDPVAIFLTIGIITLIVQPSASAVSLLPMFVQQMVFGAVIGAGLGRLMVPAMNHLNLGYDGLYAVFTLATVALVYGTATLVGGNGFLAVYLAGLVMGSHHFIHKRSIMRFHDGLAWLMQITMFLTLGLLVYPSALLSIAVPGVALALVLILVARPLSVFVSLWFTSLTRAEIALVAWVGLRGAVPIILATYPLVMNVANAPLLFNVVFFTVVLSALLQGPTIAPVARRLGVDEPHDPKPRYPLEFEQTAGLGSDLHEVVVPAGSAAAERPILELGLPDDALVVLISRGGQFIVPRGATPVLERDRLLVLTDDAGLAEVRRVLEPG